VNQNPAQIKDVDELEEMLSRPSDAAIGAMSRLKGDVIVLGVAGKMGPTLARMIVRASEAANVKRKVIGVARFSNPAEAKKLETWGIQTIKADLLDQSQLDQLPDAPNVVYMAGMKFGSTGNESLTWAMNSYLPGMVSQKYQRSTIVAFSTGNVYGLSPIARGGSIESDALNPLGDYAMSCLGRERIFEHFSRSLHIPMAMIRLNYATEMRYGVLVDLAQRVWNGEDIDVSMGTMNAIWQADANAQSIAAFDHAASPPFILNVAGPELLSMRAVAMAFAHRMKKDVKIVGQEANDSLISNGQLGHKLYGYPRVAAGQMIDWIAEWTMRGGESLGKPTHFEARDGKY
jgi:hypothetical protein